MILNYRIEQENITINDYLVSRHYSKKLISAIKYQGGEITVNDAPQFVDYVLKTGDYLKVILPKETINESILKVKMDIEIIYEDEYLLIINKEAGLPTIPSIRHYDCSLASGIMYYYDQIGLEATIHFINRLDKDTSGLVMIAKNRFIHHLFSNHVQIEKKYLALVSGMIQEDQTIEANIKRESDDTHKRIVASNGEYALTILEVVKNYKDYSLVELTLVTGRTHQIRVHMAYINHPLLGDALYGGNVVYMNRHALHSYKVKFNHPILNKMFEFTIQPPEDMIQLMNG